MKSAYKSLIHLVVFLTDFRIVTSVKWIVFAVVALLCSVANYFENSIFYDDILPQTGQILTCETGLSGYSDKSDLT